MSANSDNSVRVNDLNFMEEHYRRKEIKSCPYIRTPCVLDNCSEYEKTQHSPIKGYNPFVKVLRTVFGVTLRAERWGRLISDTYYLIRQRCNAFDEDIHVEQVPFTLLSGWRCVNRNHLNSFEGEPIVKIGYFYNDNQVEKLLENVIV